MAGVAPFVPRKQWNRRDSNPQFPGASGDAFPLDNDPMEPVTVRRKRLNSKDPKVSLVTGGGAGGNRTLGLYDAIVALSQLSYSPILHRHEVLDEEPGLQEERGDESLDENVLERDGTLFTVVLDE
jgi:hypothetical protein